MNLFLFLDFKSYKGGENMKIKIKEVTHEELEVETVEQLLQAGSCGGTSGGCEAPLSDEKD